MICKKCKTAVPENVHHCANCGTTVNKGAVAKKAMGIIVSISIAALCGVYMYFQPNLFESGEDIPIAAATDVPEASESIGVSETQRPAVTADLSKEPDDVFDMLSAVYEGAIRYHNEAPASRPFISKQGFLYDLATERLVTIQDLINADTLNATYAGENIFILYIAPAALAAYDEVSFRHSADLRLFTGYATKDGVALVSGSEKGVLYREHYNALVEQYAYDHGEIRRPDSASAEYQQILDTVISYDMIPEEVFVRYAATDDKYAVVVISKASSPDKLEGFVLENIDGQYAVVFDHFEAHSRFQTDINNEIADIHIDLLPKYTLYYENSKMETDFPALIAQLTADEAVTASDQIIFVSGNDRYAYIEFDSGLIFLANLPQNSAVWTYTAVTNWLDAELRLTEQDPPSPPTHILWQH